MSMRTSKAIILAALSTASLLPTVAKATTAANFGTLADEPQVLNPPEGPINVPTPGTPILLPEPVDGMNPDGF